MSAILLLGMGLLKAGDHVICSQSVFGSTIMLFGREFAKFGVETTLRLADRRRRVARRGAAEHEAAVRRVADQSADRGVRHPRAGRRSPTTPAPGWRSTTASARRRCSGRSSYGADLIIHSGTKYLDGQGRVIAGAICGSEQIVNEKFVPVMRSAGMSLSPFNAWVVLKGLETLSIRMQAQSARALELARWLEAQPTVERVYYPGLASHPAARAGDGAAVAAAAAPSCRSSSPRRPAIRRRRAGTPST